ncbi:PPR domain containing protein [Phanerochaete sordida]|uniref:PPR domain containing protein n=1 Tax=Phanerochaete sordida TaxID=48140 RepID=A0A9P3L7U8_9APHY|nr:PPR domain containing protein [Phanerochaete sordida]
MYRTLVHVLREFRGPEEVLNVVLHDWDVMRTYLDTRSVLVSHQKTERPTIYGVQQLRTRTFQFIADLKSPVQLLATAEKTQSSTWRLRAAELLIDVLTGRQMPHDALAVLREIYRQGLHVPGYQQLKLVQALAKADSYEIANPMFANLRKALKDHHGQLETMIAETGLYLFAMQGNVRQTQSHFRQVRNAGGDMQKAVALLLHVHAVKGDSTAAVAVFDQYCTENPKRTTEQIKPSIVHYSSVIHAHAQRGDREGMNLWLQKLAAAGHTPDAYVYNVILKAFAEKGEIASMGSVIEQMRAAGIQPNVVAYTTALSALADRRDPVAAEALFREAVKDGIVPDRAMLNTLMNAHVRAGSWRGVINVFDYMIKQSRERNVPVSIVTYNTLLKAFVSIGAPFSTVFRLFHRLEEMQLRPDQYTFALVTQSACDGNVMDVAEKLYSAVKEMARSWEHGVSLTVYLATIVMAGHLKAGNKKRARGMYREMIELGIQPSSVTFSNIVKAYSNESGETNIEIAKQFIQELMIVDPENHNQDWMQNARGAGSALEEVYGPLLWAYAKAKKPGEVEALLQELFAKGGEPSLSNLTALLDVYRRTDNIEGVREVWPQIHKMALELSDLGDLFQDKSALPSENTTRPGTRRQANILAMPLSIYIDVLSSQGYHAEVSKVWQELRLAGFSFDSHNWNHLIVALVRAGEVARAFEVIERVIIPFRHALASIGVKQHRAEPSSPLLTDYEPDPDELSRPPTLWPTGAERRAARQRKVRRERVLVGIVEEKPQDFAHALHILRQVSPQWDQWRPHSTALQALADALEHLQRGNLVQPVRPPGATWRPPQTLQDVEERARKAQETLDQIYEESPSALEYAHRWIDWRKSHGEKLKKLGLSGR